MSKSFFNFREEHGAGEDGTDALVNKYKADTPGQGGTTEPKQKARKGDMLQNKDEPEKSLKTESKDIDELSMSVKDFKKTGLNKAVTKNKDKLKKDIEDMKSRLKKEETEELEEKAPKMKGDWLKKEREKNRAHDAAMGRTATGRKKPTRPMTSTQRSLASLRKEETEQLDEAKFTDKQIKMAYGIINDPRYKSGNMTAIVRKIEQIAKGLSKHPGVQKAIQVTNEDYDIDAVIEALIEEEMMELDELEKMLDEQDNLNEEYDQNGMMIDQLDAIEHYIDGIEDYIEMCADMPMGRCPEWYQNKLTKAYVEMQSLYAYAISQMDDEDEDDEEEMDESTKAYGDTMRQKERERQMKSMKPGEMDKLRKLRQMLDREKKNK